MSRLNRETEEQRDWSVSDLGKYLFFRRYTTTGSTKTEVVNFTMHEQEVAEFEVKIIVRDADCAVYGAYDIRGMFYRAQSGSVTQIDDLYHDMSYESNTSLAVDIAADGTNQTVDISVTGLASTVLYWTIEGEVMLG